MAVIEPLSLKLSPKLTEAPSKTRFRLELAWSGQHDGVAVTSFVSGVCDFFLGVDGEACILSGNELIEDANFADCVPLLRGGGKIEIRSIEGRIATPFSWALTVEKNTGNDDPAIVWVDVQFEQDGNRAEANPDIVWLQADSEITTVPIHILGLPLSTNDPTDFFNGVVVMAEQYGHLAIADLSSIADGQESLFARWHFKQPNFVTTPIFGYLGGSLWTTENERLGDTAAPACWLERLEAGEAYKLPMEKELPENWKQPLLAILAQEQPDFDALSHALEQLTPGIDLPEFAALSGFQLPNLMTHPEEGLVVVIAPTSEKVTVAVDMHHPPELLLTTVLHGLGHVLLGHVRAGDQYGHWDTEETLTGDHANRRWDQQVRDTFSAWFEKPKMRKVESLEECTATEKAQLGLWRMMGEMLGESRRLHQKAERYQRAAYQRQAAQRLVAMLEDFGGAMLCDGVGLGKTYIATTLMVHYTNTWKEHFTNRPKQLLEDPFRITVLAPNSVVTTWHREATPPLAGFGVPLSTIRIISHTKLSRINKSSKVLELGSNQALSDLEHLLLSDLVIVDEAHNFRSVSARRTVVLRDLLRLQPRREQRRKVVLLTATPVNNSLDDLRQESALLFTRSLWLSDARTDDGYHRQAIKEIKERCARARSRKVPGGDVSALIIHGDVDARFSVANDFRDDLDFGPNVQRIGDYLKEQDVKLKSLQDQIRTEAQTGEQRDASMPPVRIAEELLDRVVVQRSRALCKEIENQQGADTELLFRPDAAAPERLHYADEYDGIKDVLARFLSLFDNPKTLDDKLTASRLLSLKVYMWYDVREGIKTPDETSSVVGLQRVLVLKRLESSPVSFLITLLRLTVLHAHRLNQLIELCIQAGDKKHTDTLRSDLKHLLATQKKAALEKIWTLATSDTGSNSVNQFMEDLSAAYTSARPAADTDDPPPQLSLFAAEEAEGTTKREQLDRLLGLKEALLNDFETLLRVTPELGDVVFGKFKHTEWPRKFIAGGEEVAWPRSAAWGLRLVSDAKLRRLVERLIQAQRAEQRVIIFSQFKDTIAYIQSVLRATKAFTATEWPMVLQGLEVDELKSDELTQLLSTAAAITGDTENRDDVVNAFAPYYRIGPHGPATEGLESDEKRQLLDEWERAWSIAIEHPVHMLFSSDVLAEGVNLQDTAVLINFDVHWNPVRMIQRAGRIDRRLNAQIEKITAYPELEELASSLDKHRPAYYWHSHLTGAPVTVNMILPDELEAELQLRERIATKTLAIDFTLGLEQGTGAEADWMESYKYQGVSSLNSFQKDRAIEQVASTYERFGRKFSELGIRTDWVAQLNGWFREKEITEDSPLVGRARFGRRGGDLTLYSRYLEPQVIDGIQWWLWSQTKPGESILNFWICLDGKNFPAITKNNLTWHATASMPLSAQHLLNAAERLENAAVNELAPQKVGRPLMQGVTALSAGFLGTENDRKTVQVSEFFLLQLSSYAERENSIVS